MTEPTYEQAVSWLVTVAERWLERRAKGVVYRALDEELSSAIERAAKLDPERQP